MTLSRQRFRLITALLLWCLLGVQWAAAAHAVAHAAAQGVVQGVVQGAGQSDRGERGHHAGETCLGCLAFHPLDHAAPQLLRLPGAVAPTRSCTQVRVSIAATPAALAANIRAPPVAA